MADRLEMKFALDDSALELQLQAFIDRGGKLRPAFADIGMDMVAITERAFERSMSPEGVPWTPSAAAKAEGRKTLIKTTNLKGSFSYDASDTGVVYGTNVFYAAFHQTGYSFRHAGRAAKLDQSDALGTLPVETLITVPARPFVGASGADLARWERTLAEYLIGSEALSG